MEGLIVFTTLSGGWLWFDNQKPAHNKKSALAMNKVTDSKTKGCCFAWPNQVDRKDKEPKVYFFGCFHVLCLGGVEVPNLSVSVW